MHGRDPRDAWLFAQRVCGSCTGVHALASVRAVEHALGATIPRNARLVRNVIAGTQYVDGPRPPLLPPARVRLGRRRLGPRRGSRRHLGPRQRRRAGGRSPASAHFREAQERLRRFVESGRVGLVRQRPLGPPRLPAVRRRRTCCWPPTTWRPSTGGGSLEDPHAPRRQEPAPADLPRGRHGADAALGRAEPRPAGRASPADRQARAGRPERRRAWPRSTTLIADAKSFVDQVYVPDVLLVARHYPEWAALGAGIGNYLAYGEFPEDDAAEPTLFLPRGRVMGRRHGPRRGGRPGGRHRDGRPRLVHLRRRRRRPPAPRRRPDEPDVRRTGAALDDARRIREVQLAQGAPLRRRADGGRAACAGPRRLRRGPGRGPRRGRPRRHGPRRRA